MLTILSINFCDFIFQLIMICCDNQSERMWYCIFFDICLQFQTSRKVHKNNNVSSTCNLWYYIMYHMINEDISWNLWRYLLDGTTFKRKLLDGNHQVSIYSMGSQRRSTSHCSSMNRRRCVSHTSCYLRLVILSFVVRIAA